MDADAALEILRTHFKKQCSLGLMYIKIDHFAPYEGKYIVICEHRCTFEDAVRRHRVLLGQDGKLLAVQMLAPEQRSN